MKKGNKGFTLIELMIVVAIIAIIASIAIPNLLSARLSANETAAIATLRNLASAQAQVQASGVIDGDGDGTGEYGFFAELSGAQFVRAWNGTTQIISTTTKVVPPVMSGAFGNTNAQGAVSRSGYLFKLYLPDGGGLGIGEDPSGGGATASIGTLNADLCETTWCAYGWPINKGNSGNRAFFVNQQGDVLQCLNNPATPYSGAATMPNCDAAFANGGTPNSISQPLSVTLTTKLGIDGLVWSNVQ